MKQLLVAILTSLLILLPGCGNSSVGPVTPNTEPDIEQVSPQSSDSGDSAETGLTNTKSTVKRVVPPTSKEGFSLNYISYPQLVDKSSDYITKEFKDLEGGFEHNFWSPVRFLDNDNFLFLARLPEEKNYAIYRYNLKTKKVKKFFQSDDFDAQSSFIQDISNFAITGNNALMVIKNDTIEKQILFNTWRERHKEYATYGIVANPYTEKVVLVNYNKRSLLTDLSAENIVELPFKGVYRASWIDDKNLILGVFDNVDTHEGSAIITYNIQSKATTKTYIGQREVFVDPYRDTDDYCGFTYIDDYTGPPHGTIGVVDHTKKKILFLELENAAELLKLQYNWVLGAVAEKPIDWKVWGRTTEGTVNLSVYDIAADSYIIRDKALPRPNGNMIISPDGKIIIYESFDKDYINQAK